MFTKCFMGAILLTEIMKNDNFNYAKPVMHGYKLLNAILTEMKTKQREIIYLIFWDWHSSENGSRHLQNFVEPRI